MSASSATLALFQAYVDGINARDFDGIAKILASDAHGKVHPDHLGAPEATSREMIVGIIRAANSVIPEAKLNIVASCVEELKVWARVTVEGTLSDGEKFNSTYVYMVDAAKDASGELKITRIEEMVDAVFGQKMHKLLQAQLSKK